MLYGHIEEPRHRVDHVLRLRELQDETGGFAVFIPLRYQHDFVDCGDGKVRNRLQARTTMAAPARVAEDVRGLPAAVRQRAARQVLLGHARPVRRPSCRCNFGVDDLDGSVVEYKITHDADSLRHAEHACTARTCST